MADIHMLCQRWSRFDPLAAGVVLAAEIGAPWVQTVNEAATCAQVARP